MPEGDFNAVAGSSGPAVSTVLKSARYELALVILNATPICIGISLVSLFRHTFIGIFYWPLKICAMTKICLVPEDPRVTQELLTLIRLLTLGMAFIILSKVGFAILQLYSSMETFEKHEYAFHYNFLLNFIWAVQADFLIRGVYLMAIATHNLISLKKQEWRRTAQ